MNIYKRLIFNTKTHIVLLEQTAIFFYKGTSVNIYLYQNINSPDTREPYYPYYRSDRVGITLIKPV